MQMKAIAAALNSTSALLQWLIHFLGYIPSAAIKVFSDEKIFVFIRFNISLSTVIRNLEFNMFKVSIISSGFILSKL